MDWVKLEIEQKEAYLLATNSDIQTLEKQAERLEAEIKELREWLI